MAAGADFWAEDDADDIRQVLIGIRGVLQRIEGRFDALERRLGQIAAGEAGGRSSVEIKTLASGVPQLNVKTYADSPVGPVIDEGIVEYRRALRELAGGMQP